MTADNRGYKIKTSKENVYANVSKSIRDHPEGERALSEKIKEKKVL